jgi:hypothetical protein
MGTSILSLVAILVLAIIVFRRRKERKTSVDGQATWLLRIGVVLLGIYAAYWLFFGFAEVISGDTSGLIHPLSAILLIVLMFLAWRQPKAGGVVFVILGVLTSIYYGVATMQGGRPFQPTSLLGGLPDVLFGILFLVAAGLNRRK